MNKEQAQEQLQQALTTTYLANLVFLSQYDNKLYNRLVGLGESIANGLYEERYLLEFLEESGDFDILDKKHHRYLYSRNPKKYNNKANDSVNFDSKGEFLSVEKMFFKDYILDIKPNARKELGGFYDSRSLMIKDISEYKEILEEDFTKLENKKYKAIDKFIFIGTLLGRHILKIAKKTQAKHFFVCEENLEIFRLSLFVFDYTLLVENGNTVVFSIMDSPSDFNEQFRLFYLNNALYNTNIKYFTTNYHTEHFFELIFDGITSCSPTSFDYNMMLGNIAKLSYERVNNYRIICTNKESESKFIYETPVFLVGAGPSLDESISWLKNNQNGIIIIAMGASYQKLLNEGIRVDIVVTLDPSYKILEEKQFSNEAVKRLNDTLVFASMNTHDKILEKFNKDNLFLYASTYPFFAQNEVQSGYSVGEVSASLLLDMGINDLYLIGLDFAFNQETGSTHIKNSSSSSKDYDLSDIKKSLDKGYFNINDDVIKVKGNFLDEVYTNRRFNMSAISFSNSLKKMSGKNIYNLSKNGSFIEGSIPCDINNLDFSSNSLDIKNELKKNIIEKSRIKLEQIEIDLLIQERDIVKRLRDKFMSIESKHINSFEDFKKYYIDVFDEFLFDEEIKVFRNVIFTRYFQIICGYIYYCFNLKDIKKEKSKIKEIEKVFRKQMNELLSLYIEFVEKALK